MPSGAARMLLGVMADREALKVRDPQLGPAAWRRTSPCSPLTERTSEMRGIPPVRPQTPDTPAGARQRGQSGDEHTFASHSRERSRGPPARVHLIHVLG
jgi:hypothetical protein